MELECPLKLKPRRGVMARVAFAVALVLSACLPAHLYAADPSSKLVAIPEDPDGIPEENGGWRRIPYSGTDESGRTVHSELYQVVGVEGVALAPVPEVIRSAMIDEMALAQPDETVVFALNAPIVDEIEHSLAIGQPTQALIDYANQDAEAIAAGQMGAQRGPFGSCSDSELTKDKRLQYTPNFSASENFGSGFSGTLTAQGAGNLDANGQIKLKIKRTRIFWICVPYGVRFQHVRVVGNLTLESTVTLSGTINYANPNPIEREIAKPFLGGVFFMAGPLPVYIGFNLPIVIGVEIKASITGQLQYRGGGRIAGSFDYLCTSDNCTGYNTLQTTSQNVANPIGASMSGRIQPSLYAEVAVRGFLYWEEIAYAQAGARGYLHGDLWGYYGNTCGDADQNGHYETVSALTFDLDWQIAVTAKADTFFTKPWKKTLWKSKQWHIAFWDLVESSALTPMIDGPQTAVVNTGTSYNIRMRPCWPYGDNVDYAMDWGDGATSNHSGSPAPPAWQPVVASHVWATTGPRTMQLTALRDAHGREFGKGRSTTRQISVDNGAPLNLALEALALASSTYCSTPGTEHCYDADRANDGDNSTALGGFTSWANGYGVAMPQWLELQWGRLVTVSRVDLYTSQGYPIADYDIEYWNGTDWIKAASIRGNTAVARSHSIAPVQTFRMRILAVAGPAHQPGYTRINEVEVY
ncbi:MAG: hypothetical protein E6Q88_05980 [Lysobacteraceae bacterium]|nr:MAG: hypothetical protein E6Q88_05980 [Xanthomonadaceae bacterium]